MADILEVTQLVSKVIDDGEKTWQGRRASPGHRTRARTEFLWLRVLCSSMVYLLTYFLSEQSGVACSVRMVIFTAEL